MSRPKLNKTALREHQRHLVQILRQLGEKMENLEDTVLRGPNETSADEVDEFGSEGYQQEFQLGLIKNEDEILREVHAALHRMEEGVFGICEGCSLVIPERRLAALPYARYCLDCQQRAEKGELGEQT